MMRKPTPLLVHSTFLEEKGVFLWAETQEQVNLPLSYWKHHLFMWQEESFYGTFLEEYTMGHTVGVMLPPHIAFDFFGSRPENTMVEIHWDRDSEYFRSIIPSFYPDWKEGAVFPNMEAWKEGDFTWKLASGDSEDDMINRFISYAISSKLKHNPTEQWEAANHVYKYPTYAAAQLQTAIHEEDWLIKIGMLHDDTPFLMSLSLEEPQEDGGWWQLYTVLHDKKRIDKVYQYEGEQSLPKRWKAYNQRVIDTQTGWCNVVPWLQDDGVFQTELNEEKAWLFLTDASEKLLDAGIDILLPSWWQALKSSKLSLKAQVTSPKSPSFVGMDTLVNFNWRVSTNGVDFSEEDFQRLVDTNRRIVNIKGRWIKLDPSFIHQMKKLMEKAEQEGLHFKDILEQQFASQQEEAAEEETPEVTIELNNYFRKLMKRLTDLGDVPTLEVPTSLQAELRPYQKKGMEWLVHLRQLGFGALLADDMGLGKTLQTISYLVYCKEQNLLDKPTLIIAPTSVLGNWQKEIERFAPDIKVHLHYGPQRARGEAFPVVADAHDVILTSYNLAQLDQEDIKEYQWGAICLDEAQNIKNAATKQSRAVRSFAATHRIALTGTPMENRLAELWSIFDFLNHGYLGSLHTFGKKFIAPIEKDRDEETIGKLQRYIHPFLLRRTKRDEDVALNLPDKQEQKEYCALTVEQASLYEQVVQDTLAQVQKLSGFERRGYILMMLSKLKQICNHPALYLKEEKPENIVQRSYKMETLVELLDNIQAQGESCLIFTQYIQMGEMIKETLQNKYGKEVLFLNGSVGKQRRDKMISRFQDGEVPILLLSLKAGGTGLNLTAANHVIHFDRWWNPAVENQATDRAHRIGQQRFVHVHKLITTGTLEEKIDEMLEKKQSLNDAIIASDTWITELTTDELAELLGA